MKTIQRLDDYNALRRFSVDGTTEYSINDISSSFAWSCSGGSLVVTSDNPYTPNFYVVDVAPSGPGPVTVTIPLDSFLETEDIGQIFVFTGVLISQNYDVTVTARIYDVEETEPNAGVQKTLQAGLWGAFRSNQYTVNEADGVYSNFYKLDLIISNHNTTRVRISTPNFVNDSAWLSNPVINSMKPYMPGFYAEYDALQENPRYPMFRFIDVLTDAIADTMFSYSEWFEYEEREVPAGITKDDPRMLSRVANYKVVRDEYVQWLAQFSGNKLRKQVYYLGAPVIPEENLEDFRTWQLSPAGYGSGAGTQQAIREAVQFVLTGTKTVIISQISGGDPWAIKIITITSESPDSEIILAAAEPARPLGYSLSHESVEEINLVLGDPIYGRLGSATL
jgi:hypothetical protein